MHTNICGQFLNEDCLKNLGYTSCETFIVSGGRVQAGYVKDRSISTHIVLAQEILRDLNRKATGGNVVFKLDMANAYDRLDWRFLLKAMESFGFNAGARNLICRNLCNIWYTFRINGESIGNFRSFRGVR